MDSRPVARIGPNQVPGGKNSSRKKLTLKFDSISITQAKHEEDVFVVTVVECKVVPFHCFIISVV